jgi:hypothetical protein
MGKLRFSHFTVTRGGLPCVLIQHVAYSTEGVLVPVNSEEPTRFTCNPVIENYATIYTRRRVLRAINRTEKFCDAARGSTIDEHPFVKRALAAAGKWEVIPVKCPPKPKSPSA